MIPAVQILLRLYTGNKFVNLKTGEGVNDLLKTFEVFKLFQLTNLKRIAAMFVPSFTIFIQHVFFPFEAFHNIHIGEITLFK
jgi:hypothetical protein